jgi:hypothetical protein
MQLVCCLCIPAAMNCVQLLGNEVFEGGKNFFLANILHAVMSCWLSHVSCLSECCFHFLEAYTYSSSKYLVTVWLYI